MIRRRIWLGIGASVLTSASSIANSGALSDAGGSGLQAPGPLVHSPLLLAAAGVGEGGEGGEAGSASAVEGLDADQRYTFYLFIMRGHLRIGHELAGQGHWEGAYPHFLHPIPEGYDPIEKELARRGVLPFEDALKALAQTVARHDAKAMETGYRAVLARIDAAAARVDAGTRASPATVATVATRLMRKAADEYGESIEKGRIAEAHEYQDARGFLLEVDDYLKAHAPALRAADAAALRTLEASLAEALRATPTARPPKAALVEPGIVSAAVSRAEFAASGMR
jgi:hypothetical protein